MLNGLVAFFMVLCVMLNKPYCPAFHDTSGPFRMKSVRVFRFFPALYKDQFPLLENGENL